MLKKTCVLLLFLCLSAGAANAQDSGALQGFTGRGSAVIQAVFGGMKLNLGADIGLMMRGQALRLDVSRFSAPGSDAMMGALVQQFLPQGSFTAVIDRGTHTVTLWSNDRRLYYVHAANASASTSTDSSASGNAVGAVFDIQAGSMLQILKSIKDYSVYDMSARLGGHGNVNGHSATTIQYSIRTQKRGGALSTMSGDIALADDAQGLPVRITSAMRGKNFNGSFRLDFSSLSASAPDASAFAVPAGFTQTSDPSQIFGISRSVIPH